MVFRLTETKVMNLTDKVEVNQKAALGSQTTQIAVQNNMGLSVSDATHLAFELFREYYPQLRDDALTALREMVEYELEKMQPEEIIPPKPRIAVPVLQNASITDEDSIRKTYAKLLASSMNAATAKDVHPAFVTVVNQLDSYDAKVLEKISKIHDTIPAAKVRFTFETKYLSAILPRYFSPYFYDSFDVWAVSVSLDNLSRLNIITIGEGSVTSYDYQKILDHPFIQAKYQEAVIANPSRNLEIKQDELFIQMSDFGNKFLKICFPGQ